MVALISEAEKAYIALGCQQNVREDGRTSMDFRFVLPVCMQWLWLRLLKMQLIVLV